MQESEVGRTFHALKGIILSFGALVIKEDLKIRAERC